MLTLSLLIILHLLAALIWVGGMFFAYLILRPSLGVLAAPDRARLWLGVFRRFFPWVWASIAALLVTGYAMLFGAFGGFAEAGVHIHVMHLTGWIMFLLFAHLYFAPWRRFRMAVETGDGEAAAKRLGQIRLIVAINLALGIATSAIGAGGRYWG